MTSNVILNATLFLRIADGTMKHPTKRILWVFMLDTGDTLWDEETIFTKAQTALLSELRKNGIRFASEGAFNLLRKLDDRLIEHYDRFEYDFRALILALIFFFKGNAEDKSIRRATRLMKEGIPQDLEPIVTSCYNVLRNQLQTIPRLLRGVKATLRTLRSKPSVVCLFSEGDCCRIERVIAALTLRKSYDFLYVRKKTERLYRHALHRAQARLRISGKSDLRAMVVGDLLDRDIRIGKKIGAVSVHRLGGYKPGQRPRNRYEKPDYVIEHIPQLVRIVEQEEKRAHKKESTA